MNPLSNPSVTVTVTSSSTTISTHLPGISVSELSDFDTNCMNSNSNGWLASFKRMMTNGSIWWIKDHMLGTTTSNGVNSNGDIWLLGVCYKFDDSNGFSDFLEDFSSRILITYRKGFDPIGESKYTSDVNWGCMIRSSQMLIAQGLLVHRYGRSWQLNVDKQIDQSYTEILHEFADSDDSAFSIHQLLKAGKGYGLAPGSWVGPYVMCRVWQNLARSMKEELVKTLPFAVHVVSGDEDGERGGAPVVCVEDVSSLCLEYSGGRGDWTPVVLMVPLVLGLEKINPRYVPLLGATFTFPQSLGILGGKPGVSTYIVGIQDEKAFYLDPHETQPVVNIKNGDLDADTSSYHSNVVRHIPLESIDPSLAIGFYCRDKDDFADFCSRASSLASESNGAPLFTVTSSRNFSKAKAAGRCDMDGGGGDEFRDNNSCDLLQSSDGEGVQGEDDWQLL